MFLSRIKLEQGKALSLVTGLQPLSRLRFLLLKFLGFSRGAWGLGVWMVVSRVVSRVG